MTPLGHDLWLTLVWLVVLGAGLMLCVGLARAGVRRTHVRDLLHIGAGVWVLGWPWWQRPVAPIAITAAALLAVAIVPRLARRWRPAQKLMQAVSGDDESWDGLVLYTAAFAAATAVGLLWRPLPSAAALWALCLGDGLGGAVGRRFGRMHYRAPGAKVKSLEGSLTVVAATALAVFLAVAWFRVPALPSPGVLALTAGVAGLAEGLAPRGTDNALVPLAVWLALVLGAA